MILSYVKVRQRLCGKIESQNENWTKSGSKNIIIVLLSIRVILGSWILRNMGFPYQRAKMMRNVKRMKQIAKKEN